MTGSTMAETIVIHVRISMAAKTDEIELIHANRMFFMSFISFVRCQSFVVRRWFLYLSSSVCICGFIISCCFAEFTEDDLPV